MAKVTSLIDAQTNEARPGFRLADRYVLTRAVRSSSVGQQYLADDTEAAKQVLVVLHQAPWSDDPASVELFERRARALQSLEHANISSVLDWGVSDGKCFAVLDRFDGERLADRLTRKRRMSIHELLPIASQLLKALEYVHARGLVVRTLDAFHVLLCTDGVHANLVRLTSVGVSELVQNLDPPDEEELTGDARYAAPEQLRGDPVDARADVFALGRLLIAMLQGSTSPKSIPLSQRTAKTFALPAGSDAVPESLLALIESCVKQEPDERPGNGADLVERLIDAVPDTKMFRLPRITGSIAAIDRRPATSSARMVRAAVVDPGSIPEQHVQTEIAAHVDARRRSWVVPILGIAGVAGLVVGAWWMLLPPRVDPETEPETAPVAESPTSSPLAVAPVAAPHPEPSPSDPSVRIEARPAGTLVIDGVQRGSTPFEGTLPAGEHSVEVVASEGSRWKETITVVAGANGSWVLTGPAATPADGPDRRDAKRDRRRKGAAASRPSSNAAASPSEPAAAPAPSKPAANDDPFLAPSKRRPAGGLLPGSASK
jgi:serine/threonine protein kinase